MHKRDSLAWHGSQRRYYWANFMRHSSTHRHSLQAFINVLQIGFWDGWSVDKHSSYTDTRIATIDISACACVVGGHHSYELIPHAAVKWRWRSVNKGVEGSTKKLLNSSDSRKKYLLFRTSYIDQERSTNISVVMAVNSISQCFFKWA